MAQTPRSRAKRALWCGLIGRRSEVHHINKRRDDNRIENLYLCETKYQHVQVEKSLIAVVSQLVDSGVITFNIETGQYETLL